MDQNGDYVSVCSLVQSWYIPSIHLYLLIHSSLLYSQAFVLGIQFDIGNKDASARKMKMIDDLFRALPDSVVANPEHLHESANSTVTYS